MVQRLNSMWNNCTSCCAEWQAASGRRLLDRGTARGMLNKISKPPKGMPWFWVMDLQKDGSFPCAVHAPKANDWMKISLKVTWSGDFALQQKCIICLWDATKKLKGICRQNNQGLTQNRWTQSGNKLMAGQYSRLSSKQKHKNKTHLGYYYQLDDFCLLAQIRVWFM